MAVARLSPREGGLLERVRVRGARLALGGGQAAPLRRQEGEDLLLLRHERRLAPLRALPLLAHLGLHALLEEARLVRVRLRVRVRVRAEARVRAMG